MNQCQCGLEIEAPWQMAVDRVIRANQDKPGALIQILEEVQSEIGYLPENVQAYLAEQTGVPLSEIYGVVTFYALFHTEPVGEHKISICLGTACYVKGAGDILAEFEKQLGIKAGQTTADRKFTLEACRCLGACGLAPVLTIGGEVYGSLTVDDVARLLEKYR